MRRRRQITSGREKLRAVQYAPSASSRAKAPRARASLVRRCMPSASVQPFLHSSTPSIAGRRDHADLLADGGRYLHELLIAKAKEQEISLHPRRQLRLRGQRHWSSHVDEAWLSRGICVRRKGWSSLRHLAGSWRCKREVRLWCRKICSQCHAAAARLTNHVPHQAPAPTESQAVCVGNYI